MTPTPPRARIQRLEQSLFRSRPAPASSRSVPRRVRGSVPSSRAYDTGQPASLYLVRSTSVDAVTVQDDRERPETGDLHTPPGPPGLSGRPQQLPEGPGTGASVHGGPAVGATGDAPAGVTAGAAVVEAGAAVGSGAAVGAGAATPAADQAADQAAAPAADQAAAPATGPTPGPRRSGGEPGSGDPAGMDGWRTAPEPADEDEAFAQDIQAIIAHAQSVGGSSQGQLPLPSGAVQGPNTPPPQAAPSGPPPGVGPSATHDVFEAMALANAPSRFAQGPVALSVDFDRLDRALEDVRPADGPAPAGPAPDTPAVPVAGVPTGPAATGGVDDVADVAAITSGSGPFRVVTDAQLIPQVPGLSCHAAACASLVAWRDEMPPDAASVAAATGYWERYADGRTAVFPDVFEIFGLATASAGRPPSPMALRDLLDTQGPLFVAAAPPAEHAVVVSGITGDGTATGTIVDVVDPWAQGMTTFAAPNQGSTYSVPLATFLERLGAGPEHQILVAHLRKGMS